MKPSLVSRPLLFALALSIALALPVYAETSEELQTKIADKNAELEKLETEIAQYEKQLDTIGTARKTLEGEVQRLDVSRKKISTDIAVTENRISTATLKLQDLGGEILDKEARMQVGRATIEASLRAIDQLDNVNFAERYLASATLADGWQEVDRLNQVQEALREEIAALTETRTALTVDRDAVAAEEQKLRSYKRELAGQKTVLDENRKTQTSILTDTKSRESEYQKLLEEKRAQQLELEQEIRDYESAIDYSYDQSKLPSPGSGVIGFPLDPPYMLKCADKKSVYKNIYCITQYFGNTAFAQSGAYNGKGHNGIDFGAPEGTKIVASLGGVVEATGNTDEIRGCYSYGKWALIRHANGLMTLYAHLSAIGVVKGQSVGRGEFVGFSGKTGYATGPHLHFTLFAADGVELVRLGDIKVKTNCANAIVPVAPTAAYLNPIQYL